jgi:rod shape-determining protein MreD
VGRYLGIPLLLIAAIIQTTVIPEIRIGEAGPDLILMLVVTWTLLAGFEEAVLWALAGGIVADLLTRTPTGTTAFALVFVSFVISNVPGQISRNNILFPPLVVAGSTIAYHLLIMLVLRLTGTDVSIDYVLLRMSLPGALYNAILILPLFRLFGSIYERYRPHRIGIES